eukprot:1157891-Pelagomonas_calceolata.AAC.9
MYGQPARGTDAKGAAKNQQGRKSSNQTISLNSHLCTFLGAPFPPTRLTSLDASPLPYLGEYSLRNGAPKKVQC